MLNPSDKWDIERKLGEMLRQAEKRNDAKKEGQFRERLLALIQQYELDNSSVIELLSLEQSPRG